MRTEKISELISLNEELVKLENELFIKKKLDPNKVNPECTSLENYYDTEIRPLEDKAHDITDQINELKIDATLEMFSNLNREQLKTIELQISLAKTLRDFQCEYQITNEELLDNIYHSEIYTEEDISNMRKAAFKFDTKSIGQIESSIEKIKEFRSFRNTGKYTREQFFTEKNEGLF